MAVMPVNVHEAAKNFPVLRAKTECVPNYEGALQIVSVLGPVSLLKRLQSQLAMLNQCWGLPQEFVF
jgi:hypothetical protein